MGFSTAHIEQARTFIRQAKSRPIEVARQVEFALARTQAGTKLTRDDAKSLVESLWHDPPPVPTGQANAARGRRAKEEGRQEEVS